MCEPHLLLPELLDVVVVLLGQRRELLFVVSVELVQGPLQAGLGLPQSPQLALQLALQLV